MDDVHCVARAAAHGQNRNLQTGELYDQVTRWIERLNDYGITKWILYLSALEEEDGDNRISLERIQQELQRRDKQNVSLETIREVLVKLSRGDMLEYLELGGWFRKIDDPIMLEFLKVWSRIEVESKNPQNVQEDIVYRYQTLERQIREYKGYLAEVFMSQVLLGNQHKTLPGKFLHCEEDIKMNWPINYVRHRVRIESGKGKEIDLLGSIGVTLWVCQSKWVTGKR